MPTNISDPKTSKTLVFRQVPEEFVLIGDRYLVEVLEVDDVTPSGILIPGDPLTRAWECAKVLVVGNGDRLDSAVEKHMYFKVGDIIMIERLSGREIFMGERKCRIVNQVTTFGRFTAEVKE